MEHKILSSAILVLAPLVAMLIILCPLFPSSSVYVRRFSKWFAGAHFVYSLLFWICFNPDLLSASFQNEISLFNSSWINVMGVSATFMLDGISLLLCILTSFITFVAFIVSKYSITSKFKLYYSLIFLMETSVLGVFCARDIFLFFLFWMLTIIPTYFLISIYGGENSQKTAGRYLAYHSFANISLLFSILILYYYNFTTSGVLTANIDALGFDEFTFPVWFQFVTFIGFLIGFAVKLPLFPFHLWYSDTQETVPTPVNMVLSALLLPMGAYGILKFNMVIFPTAFKTFAFVLMILALINIIYFAFVAFAQKKIKRIISCFDMIQAGFVLLGLTTVTAIGFTGSIFLLLAHGIIGAALFLIAGLVVQRTKTQDIEELGGIGRNMPKLMYFAIPVSLATMGVPFFMLFPSQFMIFVGAFTTDLFEQVYFQIGTIFGIIALIFCVIAIARFLHKVFFANMLSKFSNIKDVSMSEFFSLLLLLIPMLLFGCAPMLLISIYNNVVAVLIDILRI